MASYQITVDADTPEEAEEIMNKIQGILADIIENGAPAVEKYAQSVIPKRSGRLAGGTSFSVGGSNFEISNSVYYGIWVDKGHNTPRAFRGHPAKHVSHVPGKFFSDKIWQFVQDDVNERCQALLALE